MKQYLVVKSVQLLVGHKTYRKDMVMTAEDVGEDKIKRYLEGGYIKLIGTNVMPDPDDAGEDEDDENIEFLAPEKVAKLTREGLRIYARKIGVSFANSISDASLASRVNEFISDAMSNEGNDSRSEQSQGIQGDAGQTASGQA